MRLIRWVIGGVVAVGLLALAGAAFWPGSSTDCPAVSVAAPAVSFIGTAQAEDGGAVTFEVEQWSADRLPPGTAERLSPGDVVVVRYSGGDERFVHVGQRYQVDAWGETPDDLASGVHTAGECSFGSGTVNADGTSINTGLLTRDGIEPYSWRIAGAALLTAAVTGAVIAYRRVRHPRLTIDGRPRR